MASGKKFLSYAGRALILFMLVLSYSPEISATGLLPTGSSKAIDFSLENILDGKSVTLSKSCDKVIVLEFGSRYCKPCMEMVPDLVKLYDNYKSSGLMIFKIDIDSDPDKQVMKKFASEKKMHFPYLVGNKDIARQYGVILLPTIFILDKDKNVVKKYIGYQSYNVLEADFKSMQK
jgi:thiol-disulfide isomerase/thioredoxin